MASKNNVDVLADLIKSKKVNLLSYSFEFAESPIKEALINWLSSENFPTENPTDIVGDTYVVAWFENNFKLIVFNLSYSDAEQCGGTIVFSMEGGICKCLFDTVECSS